MAKILCTGIATLDIINEVKCYPDEDDEIRILSQEKRRGGNATNTAVILSQLGHECFWAGTLVNEVDSQTILSDLKHYQINYDYCHFLDQGKIPTSYITLSQGSGSRTISHFRDLPEYTFETFKKINLHQFDWFHFEGRNVEETQKMMQWCRQQCPGTPISVEIEKPRDSIQELFELADTILFSKQYALSKSVTSAKDLCHLISSQYNDKSIVCAWGDTGAGASFKQGYHWQNALDIKAIDTLAAGDVFNAAIIDQQLKKYPLEKCLEFACQLAGKKCAQKGIGELFIK
ncbi:MAG: PfkB family carbohydrate kinase [Gammaproteobacteria bacterium]|nr:PfkB family carbohydrate kinase [Gammaproteobacteria bacterium]